MAPSTSQAKAWEQVGARFVALGNTLRQRLEELGTDAGTERRAVERSLRSLANALEEGFDRAGAVVRDVQLREEVAGIVASLRTAVVTTFAAVDGQPATAKKATAKKATAKKATAKKATAKKATAKKATAKKATAKKATVKKATAKKATVKKATAKKAG